MRISQYLSNLILNVDARVPLGLWTTRTLSRVQVPDLRLCDLTDELTRSRAKVDVSALTHTDLSVSKAWGLAIERHPANFDGLRYRSHFDNQPCIALLERAPRPPAPRNHRGRSRRRPGVRCLRYPTPVIPHLIRVHPRNPRLIFSLWWFMSELAICAGEQVRNNRTP